MRTSGEPPQLARVNPPTRWHRWNNGEHDIISQLMEVAVNQEQRIRVLEAAEAERQTTAKPEFSKLRLGAGTFQDYFEGFAESFARRGKGKSTLS
jgi:hypothetical protein